MTSSLPSLSIIIANYNYADYVGSAIDSALAVDLPQVQVIVVDDGSTDASRGIIDRYGGRVVRRFCAGDRGCRDISRLR
jgi:glycosyltransferase involved in cell wall biosynthesis